MKQVQVAVVGASGYTGQELLRILLNHRGVKLVCATSRQYAGQPLWEVFPRFRQVPGSGLKFTDSDVEAIAATGAEVAFLALPHGVAASYARGLVDRGLRVIDLSADFRLDSPEVYEEYYGNPHPDTALMQEAVYGLPEWRREEIARARIVASPGCYPTSILLPLIPLFRAGMLEPEDVVEAMLAQGYYSLAVPLPFEYQDYMRVYCAIYGCAYPLALAVAERETGGKFNMDAVGPAGEVGIMQLNPGPDGAYHAELEAATGLDPTTPEGNIAGGCYKLGTFLADYGGDTTKALMAYNMGPGGAASAWRRGITSTEYTTAVLEYM